MKLVLTCFAIMGVSFAVSVVITYFARNIAAKLDFVDKPGKRKIHDAPVALAGGLSVYVSFLVVVLAGLLVMYSQWGLSNFFKILGIDVGLLQGVSKVLPQISIILTCIGAIMLMGFLDDLFSIRIRTKLLVEGALGVLLFFSGIRVTFFVHSTWLSLILTVAWVILITNSFNLLDNMDGLTGGIAFISGFFLLLVALEFEQYFVGFFTAAFCGALLGFLVFNFQPASIFMGDAGSLSVGFTISVLTIIATYYRSDNVNILPIFIPFFILAIPIFDTLSVIAIRLKQKRPILEGDKSHFSHRLVNLGLSRRNAVLFIYMIAICLALPSVLINKVDAMGAICLFVLDILIIGIIIILEYAAYKNNKSA